MQDEGLIGRLVGGMIRRSVKARFRNVYWMPSDLPEVRPLVFVVNHHSWFDGYIMYHLVTRLGVRCLDWIAEYALFPLFGKVGGLPFPPDQPEVRASTIRRTIRLMNEESRSLVIFAEGVLHEPPEVLPFGRALDTVLQKTNPTVVPVALRYTFDLHERPEAWIRLGTPIPPEDADAEISHAAVVSLLEQPLVRDDFEVLASGTLDVNERWDNRRRRP